MIAALALALATAAPQPAVLRATDPPVKVWLNSDADFVQGDHARVHVRAQQDGYIVVLRADADGHLRVLYPTDPGADNFVRGGDKKEIRGRGDRDAFLVDDRGGEGLVLAAWSPSPFHFNDFVRGDHWDYAALDTIQVGEDKEAGLLSVVQDMAGGSHFDYDDLPYSVESQGQYYRAAYGDPCWGCGAWGLGLGWGGGWGWPGFRFGLAFGSPWWGVPYCWGCGGFYSPIGFGFGRPFYYGYGRPYFGYGGLAWGGRPYEFGAYGLRSGYGYRNGMFIDRVNPPLGGTAARIAPSRTGTLASRARSATASRGWTRSSGSSYTSRSARAASPRRGGFGGRLGGMRAARGGGGGAHRR
jgi:hypothetical protein